MPETGEPRLRMARYQVARYLKDPKRILRKRCTGWPVEIGIVETI